MVTEAGCIPSSLPFQPETHSPVIIIVSRCTRGKGIIKGVENTKGRNLREELGRILREVSGKKLREELRKKLREELGKKLREELGKKLREVLGRY